MARVVLQSMSEFCGLKFARCAEGESDEHVAYDSNAFRVFLSA